jgi:hypothetical protein
MAKRAVAVVAQQTILVLRVALLLEPSVKVRPAQVSPGPKACAVVSPSSINVIYCQELLLLFATTCTFPPVRLYHRQTQPHSLGLVVRSNGSSVLCSVRPLVANQILAVLVLPFLRFRIGAGLADITQPVPCLPIPTPELGRARVSQAAVWAATMGQVGIGRGRLRKVHGEAPFRCGLGAWCCPTSPRSVPIIIRLTTSLPLP